MSKIIPLSDYKFSAREKLEQGMDKLDEALELFDDMESFAGKNLAGLVYIALRYSEVTYEEIINEKA